jgi:DNA helicase-2/ATP-dependent DNA helicase PcrA
MDTIDLLNEQQMQAATFSGKHLLVLAGAGTGKTRTIIARAKHLIESGVNPKRILILSFTRKSANEIVERIKTEVPESKSEGLTGSTFHSWCMSLIKTHSNIFPQAEYTVLDEDDRDSCFSLMCGRNWSYKGNGDKKFKPSDICEVYSYMINAQCSLSSAIRIRMYDHAPETMDVEKDNHVLKGVIASYIEYKQKRKYIDYDDILLIVSKYLKKNEGIRKQVAGLYDHILIDEMQDTNPLQYELLSSFYEDCHLFCVGDDAQSIYGFRGADFKTMHHFAEIVKGAETIKLTINYRSTQSILDLANWLLDQSPLNYDKHLTAFRGAGFKPVFKHWADEWEEANNIADTISTAFSELGHKWMDNLVLSRSVWGLHKVEAILAKRKIPYNVFGGRSMMSSRHIRDITAALRIISNYLDELAWARYLRLWNNVGPVTAHGIIEKVLSAHSLEDSLETLIDVSKEKQLQNELAETLIKISDLQSNPSQAIVDALEIMSNQLAAIYKEEWQWRKEDFPLLAEVARAVGSISEFVAEYVLDPKLEMTEKREGIKKDCVILSTIHSAKGLEADNVYLVNASPRSFPTQKAMLNGEDSIEEERRCLYVALTRAKNHLYVYRDIHSIRVSQAPYSKGNDKYEDENEDRYFFNNLPNDLVEIENIAANYIDTGAINAATKVDSDIYADIDLN